ncbi:hypothetical protein SORBI_3004G076300 [Sorghum bicolor]|uniref:Uncharacterized protein n=1 Tax=Sorghum bicolor TaxID=4558 RepID=A0A1Z5RLD9_SORBI|nr:hypothetical protein SORBI_3004G076300 [Sorghum bicolor]
MGSTLSCIHGNSVVSSQSQQSAPPEPAMVIAPNGTLKEVPPASDHLASVSDVLGSGASFFVCNSDALYFNEPPPALAAAERLRPGQMYFVLPAEMLGRPLSTADMAALAVRATSALGTNDKPPWRCRRGRVVPVTGLEGKDLDRDEAEQSVFYETLNELTLGGFAVFTATARSDEKVAAVALRGTESSSAFTRMLSMIREDAE